MTATVAWASLVNMAAAAGRCLVRNAATAGCCSDHEARWRAPRTSNRDGSLAGFGGRLQCDELPPKQADELKIDVIAIALAG